MDGINFGDHDLCQALFKAEQLSGITVANRDVYLATIWAHNAENPLRVFEFLGHYLAMVEAAVYHRLVPDPAPIVDPEHGLVIIRRAPYTFTVSAVAPTLRINTSGDRRKFPHEWLRYYSPDA